MTDELPPYKRGAADAKMGKDLMDCPFYCASMGAQRWRDGWMDFHTSRKMKEDYQVAEKVMERDHDMLKKLADN